MFVFLNTLAQYVSNEMNAMHLKVVSGYQAKALPVLHLYLISYLDLQNPCLNFSLQLIWILQTKSFSCKTLQLRDKNSDRYLPYVRTYRKARQV